MSSLSYVKEGLLLAGRHKRMVLALWLVSLLPALALAAMIAAYLVPALGHSIFADRALTGDWFTVLRELRSPASDSLRPVFGVGAFVMAGLTLLLQVVVSSGVVEVALERTPKSPFSLGIRKNFLRFLRTSLLVSPGLVVAAIAARLSMKGFGKLAESQSDGRFDILGIAAAVLVFFLLWAPLDLAGDLSRIAAAYHDQRSMVFGFFRTLWAGAQATPPADSALSGLPGAGPGDPPPLLPDPITLVGRDRGDDRPLPSPAAGSDAASRNSQAGDVGRRGRRLSGFRGAAVLPAAPPPKEEGFNESTS